MLTMSTLHNLVKFEQKYGGLIFTPHVGWVSSRDSSNNYDRHCLFAAKLIFTFSFSGLMSGLTLGLLSLDMMGLEVMKQAGTPVERKYATKIYPVIKRHHILLVTLLLGNAACVESMPIFLDKISNPAMAIIISVTAVLLFGE